MRVNKPQNAIEAIFNSNKKKRKFDEYSQDELELLKQQAVVKRPNTMRW